MNHMGIPSTAEVPKKNASKRKWKVFKDQMQR